MVKILEKQSINDSIVNIISETRNYSYNNVTLAQELIDENNNQNNEISRFNWWNATIDNSNAKLAYYHSLYFTTNPFDNIDTTINENNKNKNVFLLQYKQEGIIDLSNRIFDTFNINYDTSNQILSTNWEKWFKKFKFPTINSYYLNKIITWDSSYKGVSDNVCANESEPWDIDNFYIRFSTSNLNYDFFVNWLIDKDFDYLLCFSNYELEYEKVWWFWLRFNRDNIETLFLEKIRTY